MRVLRRKRAQAAELQTVQGAIDQEEKRYLELERQWEDWLMSRSLPQSLSPDVMLDVFVKVEQGQELIRQREIAWTENGRAVKRGGGLYHPMP